VLAAARRWRGRGEKELGQDEQITLREEVIDALEGEATILAYIIEGAAEERLKLHTGSFDGRRAILARYGVRFAPRHG
jgi:hypothetical protein